MDKIPLDLLLLADPSIDQINTYLDNGKGYGLYLKNTCIGAFVLFPLSAKLIEIKNIAIVPEHQQKGYGTTALREACKLAVEGNYTTIRICTGNSSIGQLALYQKEGFDITSIQYHFFTMNYPAPIFENGIPCKHLIVLEKKLNSLPLDS